MTHPLEFMTDLWPRLFTDIVTVCRARAVSRAFLGAELDYAAATMVIHGDKLENGTEIVITNHKYCGPTCAAALIGGTPLTTCHSFPVLRIVILDNIIYAAPQRPPHRHTARVDYPCTNIHVIHVHNDEKITSQISPLPPLAITRYDIVIDGTEYQSTIPGVILERLLRRYMDVTLEYF